MSNSNPGSDEAVKQVCTCPVEDNRHGAGAATIERCERMYWVNGNCPLHGSESDA